MKNDIVGSIPLGREHDHTHDDKRHCRATTTGRWVLDGMGLRENALCLRQHPPVDTSYQHTKTTDQEVTMSNNPHAPHLDSITVGDHFVITTFYDTAHQSGLSFNDGHADLTSGTEVVITGVGNYFVEIANVATPDKILTGVGLGWLEPVPVVEEAKPATVAFTDEERDRSKARAYAERAVSRKLEKAHRDTLLALSQQREVPRIAELEREVAEFTTALEREKDATRRAKADLAKLIERLDARDGQVERLISSRSAAQDARQAKAEHNELKESLRLAENHQESLDATLRYAVALIATDAGQGQVIGFADALGLDIRPIFASDES